ncbi:DUF3237 family protein [Spirillospora sp. NPDC048819]|uniref:DUF3237 family protein n=1 Tax=Spirillospora sp. NPDC048819 TaxID=3155268 RepID=UPI0033E6FF5D
MTDIRTGTTDTDTTDTDTTDTDTTGTDTTARDGVVYRFEGRLTESLPVGLTPDGPRWDNHFGGKITEGEFAGAAVTGIDYFRVRADGVGVVDARELMTVDGHRVAVTVTGYILPPADLEAPPPEVLAAPDFTFPDVPFKIEAMAVFETGAPELAHLNRLAVIHNGTVNMATGELHVEARRFGGTKTE